MVLGLCLALPHGCFPRPWKINDACSAKGQLQVRAYLLPAGACY